LDEVVVLTRPSSYECEIELGADDPEMLEYKIISAYLKGYDKVYLRLPKKCHKSVKHLENLKIKLDGISLTYEGGRYVILISTEPRPVLDLLDNMFMHYETLQASCKSIMEGFYIWKSSQLESVCEDKRETINFVENSVDRLCFLVKRLLHKTSCFQIDQEKIGVKSLGDIHFLGTINVNLERLSDLQKEIYEYLVSLLPEKKRVENYFKVTEDDADYSFTNYYDAAHQMVQDAYKGEEETALKIIATKKRYRKSEDLGIEIPYRPAYIELNQREKILRIVEEYTKLGCLEHIIWGMTGNATNIAEARYNMGFKTEQKKTGKTIEKQSN